MPALPSQFMSKLDERRLRAGASGRI